MKRKMLAALLALTLCASLLAGCGASKMAAEFDSNDYAYEPEMPAAEAADGAWSTKATAASAQETGSALASQKIIRTADLNLETTDFESTVAALTALTESMDGYFENTTQGSGSAYRWASFTVRVPAAQFQSFLTQVGSIAHETWRSVDQQNITEAYYDTEGRLETQKIKLERLQGLLKEAKDMADIITIESAISETEWQIEDLSGTLRHYDSLVDYATIRVDLNEVYKYSNVEIVPKTLGERLASAFSDGWTGFVNGMEAILVALAYGWLWIVLLAAIAAGVIRLVRKGRAKKAAKKSAAASEAQTEAEETTKE